MVADEKKIRMNETSRMKNEQSEKLKYYKHH